MQVFIVNQYMFAVSGKFIWSTKLEEGCVEKLRSFIKVICPCIQAFGFGYFISHFVPHQYLKLKEGIFGKRLPLWTFPVTFNQQFTSPNIDSENYDKRYIKNMGSWIR